MKNKSGRTFILCFSLLLGACSNSGNTYYTVDFNVQGHSEAPASQTVKKGGKVVKPVNPTCEGYTFKGWFKETSCETEWNFNDDLVNSDLILFAKWISSTIYYTVKFDVQGHGESPADQTVEKGKTVSEPSAPTCEGYTFKGWYKENSCETEWNFDDEVNNDMTLYAKWEEADNFTVSPAEDIEVDLNNDKVKDVVENYEVGYSEKYRANLADQYVNDPLVISWTNSKYTGSYYLIDIGLKSDLSDKESYVVFEPNLKIENAYTGVTYYYKITVKDKDGKTLDTSLIHKANVKLTPRCVYMEEISNTRDLGGYETNIEGKKIKQGLVYRGMNVDALETKESAKNQFLNDYKIKTDLDVRNETETGGRTTSPSGCDTYEFHEGIYYLGGTSGIDIEANQPKFGNEIKVFANANNYPIFYHCAIGRDRTGCLGAILLAILGVSETDILLDYELSMLSYSGTKDLATSKAVMENIQAFLNYFKENGSGTTFNEKVISFLINKCGVTQDNIAAIQNNLLEDK